MKKVNGGLTAAILLGRAGWTVELFDRLCREDVATDWSENIDLSVFDRLELDPPPADCYRKKKNWAFLSPDGATNVVAYGPEESSEVLIDRRKLTEYLMSIAEINATFHFEAEVTELIVDSGHVSGIRVDGVFMPSDLTIDCTGPLSELRQQAPMPKQTIKMYLRQRGKPGLAWCVSDVSDYCADVLVGKFGGVTEADVEETVNDLRDNNPIIGIEEEKPPVEARIPVRQYMTKMVVPGYVILGATPYMTIPVMTPPLSDTMDAARILCEVLAVNSSCETDDLYVYQVRFCREYIAKEVAADVFRSWLLSTDVEEQNFLFQSELIDGDFLSDLMSGVLPSITSKGRGFFGMGVKKPAVVNALRAVLVDMKDAYDLVQDIPDSYNKTTYMKWQADVDSLYQ